MDFANQFIEFVNWTQIIGLNNWNTSRVGLCMCTLAHSQTHARGLHVND